MIIGPVIARINFKGDLVVTDMGCGCCSDQEDVTVSNVDTYIKNLEDQLGLLKKFKEEKEKQNGQTS